MDYTDNKVAEGKSKIIYEKDDWLYFVFKGDVRCSKHGEVFHPEIALLRAMTSYRLFQYLRTKMDKIACVEFVEPGVLRMEKATPFPLEWIPRYVAAGSVVKRFGFTYGHTFSRPILKIDYKTEEDDYLITDDLIVEKGLMGYETLVEAKALALRTAKHLHDLFLTNGLDLWDLKLELGMSSDNKVLLIDEISFDCMRLKDIVTGRSLDKDIYRDTNDIDAVIRAYIEGYERVFGEKWKSEPNTHVITEFS